MSAFNLSSIFDTEKAQVDNRVNAHRSPQSIDINIQKDRGINFKPRGKYLLLITSLLVVHARMVQARVSFAISFVYILICQKPL